MNVIMSIISEVKCARCDRKYSGVRSRCPYCGARRIGRGKYSEDSDNSKGKMLIGVLIMGVLVVAVSVLLFTTPKPVATNPDSPSLEAPEGSLPPDDEGNKSVEGNNPVETPTPTPTPSIDDLPNTTDDDSGQSETTVQKVTITYANKEKHDMTVKVGETVTLRVRIDPVGVDEEIIWTSSNRNVFEVVATSAEGTQAKVTGIGKGSATLTVSVGGVEDTCIVRGRAK